jgi:DHA1 family bicyclomycin/chloramphenicol resistance-like MFS transporter
LFSFIGSIQQIVFDVFGRPELIAIAFAIIAGPMAITSYANSRLVERLGPRWLLLRALSAFTLLALFHLAVSVTLGENIWVFCILLSLTMACFGLAGANAGALSMEPLGHIAGTASSVQGLITTIGGALIGLLIGQQFNGTVLPFLAGFFLCGLVALVLANWANPGRRAEPAAA